MNVLIYEDEKSLNLNPLVLTRPVYELRCGMISLRKKIEKLWPEAKIILHCRNILADVMAESNPNVLINAIPAGKCIFINGRVLADSNLHQKIDLNTEAVFINGDTVVAARGAG